MELPEGVLHQVRPHAVQDAGPDGVGDVGRQRGRLGAGPLAGRGAVEYDACGRGERRAVTAGRGGPTPPPQAPRCRRGRAPGGGWAPEHLLARRLFFRVSSRAVLSRVATDSRATKRSNTTQDDRLANMRPRK